MIEKFLALPQKIVDKKIWKLLRLMQEESLSDYSARPRIGIIYRPQILHLPYYKRCNMTCSGQSEQMMLFKIRCPQSLASWGEDMTITTRSEFMLNGKIPGTRITIKSTSDPQIWISWGVNDRNEKGMMIRLEAILKKDSDKTIDKMGRIGMVHSLY